MFWALKLSFVVDIFGLFRLEDCLGYFLKKWAFFFKSSGHPGRKLELNNDFVDVILQVCIIFSLHGNNEKIGL